VHPRSFFLFSGWWVFIAYALHLYEHIHPGNEPGKNQAVFMSNSSMALPLFLNMPDDSQEAGINDLEHMPCAYSTAC
jgi:hypothetical protein